MRRRKPELTLVPPASPPEPRDADEAAVIQRIRVAAFTTIEPVLGQIQNPVYQLKGLYCDCQNPFDGPAVRAAFKEIDDLTSAFIAAMEIAREIGGKI